MWSSNVEQLKTLNTSDMEVAQLVKLKHAGIGDDACVTLITGAHQRQHPFTSADSAVNLVRAGYAESVILEIAKTDQLETIGGDAVMLRLVGLSDSAVDFILHRRLKGQPTMSSAEIGRLKNTGLTEKQILERINQGMTDAQADRKRHCARPRAITRTRDSFERTAAGPASLSHRIFNSAIRHLLYARLKCLANFACAAGKLPPRRPI